MRNETPNQKKGFIAISTVLIVSAVVLAVAFSVTMRSIGNAKSSLALTKGEDALGLAEGCAEDGLLKSKANASYNGGAITRPEGTCQITISKSGTTWTMTAAVTSPAYRRSVKVIFVRTDTQITLSSWKEI